MTSSEEWPVLSSDKSVSNPNDDRLGYASFALHLADSLSRMAPPEGLVVALYGPWGSGKTSVLNLIKHYVETMPEHEQPLIVIFNPWWFSGQEDLTRRFFEQLQATLSKWRAVEKHVVERLGDLAELVSETGIPYIAPSGKVVARLLGPKIKDVSELKEKVAETLREQDKRILIIIDDIDRLTAEEVRQLFRVVKAVADFPNVMYLLSFDKEVVVRALTEVQGIPGDEYLEKIIQVPFELPLPDKTALRGLLLERLNKILVGTPNELIDQDYFSDIYLSGIDHFISTPRDIIRLTNTLGVTYPAVRGEVNPADFVAIEALRVFIPFVYDFIRRDLPAFTDYVRNSYGSRTEDLKPFHDAWLNQLPDNDREAVKRLVMRMFPKLQAILSNTFYGPESASTWRRQLRVCSSDVCNTYFRLSVPEGAISNAEMQAFLSLASNTTAFGARLVELAQQQRPDGKPRVEPFLDRLQDYTESYIPETSIQPIVSALFDVGDELIRLDREKREMFEFGNALKIARVNRQLLRRLTNTEKFDTLRTAIAEGNAVATIVDQVRTLGLEHGKYGRDEAIPEEERLVTAEQLAQLENEALQKVRKAALQEILLHAPELRMILQFWFVHAPEEAQNWVQGIIADDQGLVVFLEKNLGKMLYSAGRTTSSFPRLDPEWFKNFLEPAQIIERIQQLLNTGDLSDTQQIALKQFIREYELRQQGKDPSSLPWEV